VSVTVYLSVTEESIVETEFSNLAPFSGNTGNMVFDQAVPILLPYAQVLSTISYEDLSSFENVDFIILSLANVISAAPAEVGLLKLHQLIKNLTQLYPDLRILVFSAGSQYYNFSASNTIHESRLPFLHLLSQKANYLGTRGYYSAEILSRFGIKNGYPLGDPGIMNMPQKIHKSKSRSDIAYGNPIATYTGDGGYRDKIFEIIDWASRNNASFVLQDASDHADLHLLKASNLIEILTQSYLYYAWPRKEIGVEAINFIENRNVFMRMSEWSAYLKQASAVVGMRIHATALALKNGTPALQLLFDSRTLELSEFHMVPSMPLKDFNSKIQLEEIIDATNFSAFYKRQTVLRKNMASFFEANSSELAVNSIKESIEAEKISYSILRTDLERYVLEHSPQLLWKLREPEKTELKRLIFGL
jgi:hypothetical protein